MAEEPSLSYYLPIAGGRIIGFIPFPRVLVLCEMQSVSSRIWTRIAVFISYGDNDYTTGTLLVRRDYYIRTLIHAAQVRICLEKAIAIYYMFHGTKKKQ